MKLIQKGGLFIASDWLRNHPQQLPYHFFLENCTIQILTDTSISCVTLRCRLNDGIRSPLMDIESANGAREVREILIKVLLTRGVNDPVWTKEQLVGRNLNEPLRASQFRPGDVAYPGNAGGGGNQELTRINTTLTANLRLEIMRQSWVYNRSYTLALSEAEALCPCPLFYEFSISGQQQELLDLLRQRVNVQGVFVERTLAPNRRRRVNGRTITDRSVIDNILTNHRVSLFAMELLTGYQTLQDWMRTVPQTQAGDERIRAVQTMCLYEYIRLGRCFGIQHADSHYGNIMFNPDYHYFSNDGAFKGKVMIIDFGQLRMGPGHRVMGGAGLEFVSLCQASLDDFFFLGSTRHVIAENLGHFWPRLNWDSTAPNPHPTQLVVPNQLLLRLFNNMTRWRRGRESHFHSRMSNAYNTPAYTVGGRYPIDNFHSLVRRITGADGVLQTTAFPWHGLTIAGGGNTAQQRYIGVNAGPPARLHLHDWESGNRRPDAHPPPAEVTPGAVRSLIGTIGSAIRRLSVRIIGALAAPFLFGDAAASNPAAAAAAGAQGAQASLPPQPSRIQGVALGGSKKRRRKRRTRRKKRRCRRKKTRHRMKRRKTRRRRRKSR